MEKEIMETVFEESLRFRGNALVQWKPTVKTTVEAPADRNLLSRHLYLSEPFRKPKSFQNQRNYYGLYFFTQTQSHVWHESLNEANMMMYLDHVESIIEFNSQPMKLVFPGGSWHVPDLMALHSNNRQVVYDVKQASQIGSKEIAQFAQTQAVCAAVGWDYQVLPGLPEQVQINLTWISNFHHPLFHPGDDATARLLEALAQPIPFDEAAQILSPDALANGRSALFNLVWLRVVFLDMTGRIDGHTLIGRSRHERA